MEKIFKNDVNISIDFYVLNMSSLADVFWYGQTKFNHHYDSYKNIMPDARSHAQTPLN